MEISRAQVSAAQGYDEPEPEEVNLEPAPEPLSAAQLEKQSYEKAKLFSEFVAGEAEANSPVVKEVKVERPLHFKYYQNDGESDQSLTENDLDQIVGAASNSEQKTVQKLPYNDKAYEEAVGVTPLQPVDYSKAKIDVPGLMEPLELAELPDSALPKDDAPADPDVELTIT